MPGIMPKTYKITLITVLQEKLLVLLLKQFRFVVIPFLSNGVKLESGQTAACNPRCQVIDLSSWF